MLAPWVTLNPFTTVVGVRDVVLLLLPGCATVELTGDDAARVTAMHEALLGPVLRTDAAAGLGEALADRLLDTQHLVAGARAEIDRLRPGAAPVERPLRRLVLGVCGTFAAASVVPLVACAIERLADEVDVVMTAAARRFLRPRVLRHLGVRVYTDQEPAPDAAVPHVHLAQRADAVLVAPASAATLAKLAGGTCNDLLSLVVAATAAPVIVSPVMNAQMWRHPPIARNVAQLRADGIHVVAPRRGGAISSPSGAPEIGSLGLEPETLVSVVRAIVARARG